MFSSELSPQRFDRFDEGALQGWYQRTNRRNHDAEGEAAG
jgi:hypothetical protein